MATSAHSSVAVGMKGATKAMAAMNKEMAPAKQMKVMQEFQKQSAQMDMITEMMSDAIDDEALGIHLFSLIPASMTEMMSDAIDDVLDDDEAEDETDDLTNQVNSMLHSFVLFG
uniref:Uncharacterized protein n=1 Tax=Lactuca sativa TaxID=4236 RepID=A0A9R1VYQ9_LACSA|nr:hypothetical protein LSAT_V11C400157150 [Lactuca sativa]